MAILFCIVLLLHDLIAVSKHINSQLAVACFLYRYILRKLHDPLFSLLKVCFTFKQKKNPTVSMIRELCARFFGANSSDGFRILKGRFHKLKHYLSTDWQLDLLYNRVFKFIVMCIWTSYEHCTT